jgi:hypothetical protein
MIAQQVRIPFALAALCFTAALACAVFGGCASVPTVPQQAAVASYTAALETCVTTAKVTDGGMASYVACRNRTDQQYGLAPESATTDGGAQ